MIEKCENCKFWHKRMLNSSCRRSPEYHIHGPENWCGEFYPSKLDEAPADLKAESEALGALLNGIVVEAPAPPPAKPKSPKRKR